MGYRFLEHTADVLVECEAPRFGELLKEAARALYAVALETVYPEAMITRTIELATASREEFLVRWLQRLILLLEVEHFVATRFDIHEGDEDTVEVRLEGYVCEAEDRATEVKGATYHDIEVAETAEGVTARFVLDI